MDCCRRLVTAITVSALAGCGGQTDPADPPDGGTRPIVRTATAEEIETCRRENNGRRVAFRCPAAFPAPGGFERARQFSTNSCESLVNYEPRGMEPGSGSVFHMLIGARCGAVSLRTGGGAWPLDTSLRRDMRLIGRSASEDPNAVRLRVLRRATVDGRPALVLRNPPYPDGGIHGGHLTVLSTSSTTTYAVTGHPPIPPRLRDERGELHPSAIEEARGVLPHESRAVAQLLAVSASITE